MSIARTAIRVLGPLALILGLTYRLGYAVPLHLHMAVAGLFLFTLWVIAARCGLRVFLLTAAASLIIPALGILQWQGVMGDLDWLGMLLHPLAGLAAIALAEHLAGRAVA